MNAMFLDPEVNQFYAITFGDEEEQKLQVAEAVKNARTPDEA